MLALRQKAVQSAGRLPAAATRGTRRYATGHDHGHHQAEPKQESLGTGFFVVLAAIPISIGVYVASRPSADGKLPGLSNIIHSYSYYKERWAARNALHTAMAEQAAFDRNLYQSSPGTKHVDLKFPEIFNTGSPFNVVAGQQSRNMDELVSHYEKLNREEEKKKLKKVSEKDH